MNASGRMAQLLHPELPHMNASGRNAQLLRRETSCFEPPRSGF